jgi:hypothetical protein
MQTQCPTLSSPTKVGHVVHFLVVSFYSKIFPSSFELWVGCR